MSDEKQESVEESADIIFDCPHCGKSLEIDARGAGLMITCPDCQNEVAVPIPEESVVEETVVEPPPANMESALAKIQALTSTVASSQAKIGRLVESLEEVRGRRGYLEKLRTENMSRFDRIAGELTVIQAAIDRVVTILQDAKAEKLSDSP